MKTEKTNDNRTKNECENFECCNPENFKKMFEKMNKWFSNQDSSADFSTMRAGMMEKMMQICCPSNATDTKANTELQKKKEG